MMTRLAGPQNQVSRGWLNAAARNAALAGISIYAIGQAGLAAWMFGDTSLVTGGLDSLSGLVSSGPAPSTAARGCAQ